MLKRLLGVIAGIVAGGLIVALVESVGHMIWPPPAGTDLTDPEQMKALIAKLPFGALATVVVGWALGSLGGGWLAAAIARNAGAALTVGVALLAMGVVTMVQIPHPWWMWVLGVALPIPAAWFGARLSGKTG